MTVSGRYIRNGSMHRQTRLKGQTMIEFTFCAMIVLLMLFSLIMVFRWAGADLAERRITHDELIVRGSVTQGQTNSMVPMGQLEPYFYRPIKMNAIWDDQAHP